ncbi:VOC family protein [Falsirhodobacter xinxiangensis]|uniref:VOC family protein n=1 Tax=Falsirhodobacter xinxiangensis TaxID=2530049 RepID=UPI0010AAAD8C|nr:VOC family protein [Rhodobacter xinxiangensis]
MATKFHHINLCSTDIPGLAQFYQNVLELDETFYGSQGSDRKQITNQGYGGHVTFLTDGNTEMHLATRDLTVAFKTKQAINPLDRGHIAFRTDDIEGVKRRLTERGIPFSDFGTWAIEGWQQIFFYDPDGNIVEVQQVEDAKV